MLKEKVGLYMFGPGFFAGIGLFLLVSACKSDVNRFVKLAGAGALFLLFGAAIYVDFKAKQIEHRKAQSPITQNISMN